MIFYLASRAHLYTITWFLESWGQSLASRVQPLSYERFLAGRRLSSGTYIFADIERLAPGQAEMAARAWEQLSDADGAVRLLNHPTRSMRRYELLRALCERGLNTFNVYRLTEARLPHRFPVFLRGENDHAGSLTPLLHGQPDLLETMAETFAKGQSREDKLIVEFCDTSDARGIFRKYAAFRVGDRIIPRHIFFSPHWMIKGAGLTDEALLAEERRYVEDNPHGSLLQEIFRLARIDYGRVDYGLLDGRPQIWEVNTNPFIMTFFDGGGPARLPAHEWFSRQIIPAFEALDSDADPGVRIPISLGAQPGTRRFVRSIRTLAQLILRTHRATIRERVRAFRQLFQRR